MPAGMAAVAAQTPPRLATVHMDASRFESRAGDPPCGIAIGSHNLPSLVEMQVVLARRLCGDVPVLICDDCSDGFGPIPTGKFAELQRIAAKYPNVLLWPNAARIGHAGGDISAFWKVLIWGKLNGLRVVAKLSQRFLPTKTRWLQDGARELLASGLPLASNRCREFWRGTWHYFELRTEACLLDIDQWHRQDILSFLTPRPVATAVEFLIWQWLRERLGGRWHLWSMMPSTCRHHRDPNYLWHGSHTEDEYRQFLKGSGITLDEDFSCKTWADQPGYVMG
jgi:hypothetical protein